MISSLTPVLALAALAAGAPQRWSNVVPQNVFGSPEYAVTGEYQSNLNNVVTSGRVKPQKFVRVDIEDIEYVSEVRSLMESVLPELRTLADDPIALATANKIIQVGFFKKKSLPLYYVYTLVIILLFTSRKMLTPFALPISRRVSRP